MSKNAPSADDYTNDASEEEDVYEAEDETEVPVRSGVIQRGWKTAKKVAASSASYASELDLKNGAKLVKFLAWDDGQGNEESGPLVVYKQHFVEKLEGKKSFLCRQDEFGDCPFCDAGIRADAKFAFAVVEVADEPVLTVFTVSPKTLETLLALDSGRSGPLVNGYWEINKTGKGSQVQYIIGPVTSLKKDDVEDEAAFLSKVAKLNPNDLVPKILRYTPRDEMLEKLAKLD